MKISEIDTGVARKIHKINYTPNIGGDPEFFIGDKEGRIRSADDFFPSKHDPIRVTARNDKNSRLFFDGIQAEMAVAHQTCREYFAGNIERVWREVYNRIPSDHQVILSPAEKIRKSILDKADPEARIFGCEPDFNAYTLTTNTPEMDASEHPHRYAGGHIHLGLASSYLTQDKPEYKLAKTEDGHIRIIRFLDLLLTIPTMRLDNDNGSKLRRSKYGKAGCFRPTPYGIEYRTPSCWWLKSPMFISLVYGLARMAWSVASVNMDKAYREAVGFDEETIRGVIDESDLITADKIWKNLRPYLASTGVYTCNPLHIASLRGTENSYIEDNYVPNKNVPKSPKGQVIHSLASFEYMRENGVYSVIDKDLKKEWRVNDGFQSSQGMIAGSYKKLKGNKDFIKFQTSLLKELY